MVRSEYLPHSNSLKDLVGRSGSRNNTYDARADLNSTVGESIFGVCVCVYVCFLCGAGTMLDCEDSTTFLIGGRVKLQICNEKILDAQDASRKL